MDYNSKEKNYIVFLLAILINLAYVAYTQRAPVLSQRLSIPGAVGPESFAFDGAGGGPYTGISDGRIIRWNATQNRWINFAVTTPYRLNCEGRHNHVITEARCGRPLGLSFDRKTGQLYIADAYKGLLVVGPAGGIATPVVAATTQAGRTRTPLVFANDVAVDQRTGLVYFTETSMRFRRRDYSRIISTKDNTGRLMMFDPETNAVTVLASGLMFPNGVALSRDGEFVLVTETTNARVLRYWPSSGGGMEVFAVLPGSPDNIRRNSKGEFWVAINSRGRDPNYSGLGMAARLDQDGRILEVIQDRDGATWRYASQVSEVDGSLWVGSVVESALVKLSL
ncbi:hypothetical protein OROMI_031951 [Orobanche minor]